MPTSLYSPTPLLANRMVKQVGANIAYAQPGDTVFGCTIEPSDPLNGMTRVLLVDESPWPVEAAGIITASATCTLDTNGRAVAGAASIIGTALSRAASGVPFLMVPQSATSAAGGGGAGYATPVALTDAAPVTYAVTGSDNFSLLLTVAVGATRMLDAPTGLAPGMRWLIRIQQPAVAGPCALTFDAIYKFPYDLTPTLSTAANAVDTLSCYYDGTNILAQLINSYGTAGDLVVEGNSLVLPNTLVSGDTTLDASHYTVCVDASGGPVAIYLPAATANAGRVYNIKKVDATANAVTITRTGADVIDGATTLPLTAQYQRSTVQARSPAIWDVI